jgi:hypothetical protein
MVWDSHSDWSSDVCSSDLLTSDGVSAVDQSQETRSNSNSVKISSLKDLQQHPEFFPLWMEEIQRKNMSSLLSATAPVDSSGSADQDNSLTGGLSAVGSDPLSALTPSGDLNSSDPLSSLFSNQGSSDFSALMNPMPSLQSFQVADTLKGLQDYSNLKESKIWLGQVVSYMDPATNILKTGTVTRVDIENVSKPVFRINDEVDVSIDDLKSLNSNGPGSTSTTTA